MATHRRYTRELLEEAVRQSTSVADVLRHLGLRQAGGTHAHVSRTIRAFDLDTTHFIRHQGGGQHRRLRPEDVFQVLPWGAMRTKPHLLLRALLETGNPYACAHCENAGQWQGRALVLQVDHRDGDFHNNLADNLRLLCPNCHSQTDNFSGRGRGRFTAPGGLPPRPPGRTDAAPS